MRFLRAPSRLRFGARSPLGVHAAALEPLLSWIRTRALASDAFVLDTGDTLQTLAFPFPSLPDSPPSIVQVPVDSPRVRFLVRVGGALRRRDADPPGFCAVLRLRAVVVLERDAPHGSARPLRLGLSPGEGWAALRYARACATNFLEGKTPPPIEPSSVGVPRLSQRSAVAVALWTRGRLHGSVVGPPASTLRGVGQAAVWACQDTRFPRLTMAELDDTRFQVTLLHAPRLALCSEELASCDAYPDKALFASSGQRLGVYLPEIFNTERHRKLSSLATSVAKEKAGIEEDTARTRFEVCEVTEWIESAAGDRAVRLGGPIALGDSDDSDDIRGPGHTSECGAEAARWLVRIQREDGGWPLRVRPSSGTMHGTDLARVAMTAHGLAAFGVAYDEGSAVDAARRALVWLERVGTSGASEDLALLISVSVGKAEHSLGVAAGREARLASVRRQCSTQLSSLTASHVLSFLGLFEDAHQGHETLEHQRLLRELESRFDASLRAQEDRMSLAEWAELAMARQGPEGSRVARRVVDWLLLHQLARGLTEGAFPNTPGDDYVYTRGTGKVFEVLAGHPAASEVSVRRALRWLRSMQYCDDSLFFVPTEHRLEVKGGLRHDLFDTDAWIDSAGHLLLGLARLVRP